MSREGHDLLAAADRDRRLPEQGDRGDPRAVGVHGRLPLDDRSRDLHHQRHRARRRHPAGALAGRLRDGPQGPREAGFHRQPDAGPRLLARARDRQEGAGLRPHRPQAQAARDRAAAGDGLCRGRGAPEAVRRLGLHQAHDRGRHRADQDRGRRPDRAVQEAAPRRAALGGRRQEPARAAVLRSETLRPDPGWPLQAERPPRPRHRPRHAGPHPRRHHRPGQGAGDAAAPARDPGGDRRGEPDQGLRRGGDHLSPRAGLRPPRRVRALRQPAPAHGRRADPGGVPDRAIPDGAGGARASHHRGLRRDHPADDHQHPPGGGRAEGVLRLIAALPVHGPDQLAGRPHAPPPPLGARRRRADPGARPDRGPRRAPDPLRPDVPDRDPGGAEHRADRIALLLCADLRARFRHDPVPDRQGRGRHRRDRPPRRDPGRGQDHRPGERRDRPEHEQAEGPAGALPGKRGRVLLGGAQGRRPDGRLPDPDLVGSDGADPLPRARRRQPGADGLKHAAPGRASGQARPAADRHRDGASRGDRHRRRHPGRRSRGCLLRRLRAGGRQPRLQEGHLQAQQVHALEPGDDHPPAADRLGRPEGEEGRRPRRRLLDRGRRDRPRQELPGRLHVLGGLQLRGRDHPLRAPGQGRRAHLDPHRGVRDRRPHDQARRRGDHPRHPQPLRGEPAQPRRARHRADRRRGAVRATCWSAR